MGAHRLGATPISVLLPIDLLILLATGSMAAGFLLKAKWVSLRTTNGIERLNKEFKRRTKPMEIVAGEESVYRILAFVAMKTKMSWRKAPFQNSGFRKLKPFAGYFTQEKLTLPSREECDGSCPKRD